MWSLYVWCIIYNAQFLIMHEECAAKPFSVHATFQMFGAFLWKQFIQHTNFSKVTVKTSIMLQKISTYNKCCSFELYFHQKQCIAKIWKSITVLNIDKNVMFLEQHISEDHVTLKTGSMMLKIQLCIIEINYIWQYIHIDNYYFKY